MAKWMLMVIAVAAAVWWFTRDPVEVAYQKCLSKVADKVQATPSDQSNEIEKALADAAKGVGSAVGNAACEAMRSNCQDNRDGAICKAAMAQF